MNHSAHRSCCSGPAPPAQSRRTFLERSAMGMGGVALACLLNDQRLLAEPPPKPPDPHRARHAAAQAAISATSQGDDLAVHARRAVARRSVRPQGRDGPAGWDRLRVQGRIQRRAPASRKLLGSPWKFAKYGQCGTEVSELLPFTGGIVDDICVIRSMQTAINNHDLRHFFSGVPFRGGRPSLGSWMLYGLGCESQDLPAYVVLSDPASAGRRSKQLVERLPAALVSRDAVADRGAEDRESRPAGPTEGGGPAAEPVAAGRAEPPASAKRIRARPIWTPGSPATNWRPRCRRPPRRPSTLPQETAATQATVWPRRPGDGEFGTRCLIARRLVERGVRFVQFSSPASTGTIMATSAPPYRLSAAKTDQAVGRPGQGSEGSAACSIRRSSTGAARSAGCR